ncbi:MAG: ElyC/SanA/YdcF family protein, partial [Bacteroidota bacterium]
KIIGLNNEKIKSQNILVLGAGREYRSGKHPNYFFNGRVQAVVVLRNHYPNCKIIISGFSDGKNYDEANDLKSELLLRGVKDTLIELDHSSEDTYASLKIYNRHYLYEPVIIVSQKSHLCRILWMANQMNIDAQGFEATGWPKREPYWFLIREMGARYKATLELFF